MSETDNTTLPELLQKVAVRLDEMATHIREAEAQGQVVTASPKKVQEVVLRAIATSGTEQTIAREELMKILEEDTST